MFLHKYCTHTLCICRKRRQKPIHITLRQRSRSLYKEIRQERRSEQAIVPVNCTRVVALEANLHDDGPDVDSHVENDDGVQTNLSATALGEFLGVENEAETEAADTVMGECGNVV